MQRKPSRRNRIVVIVAGSLLSFAMSTASAQTNSVVKLFKEKGIEVGGWVHGGATYNPGHSTSGYNGTVTFGDQANRFQLNQFNIFLQRAVVTEGKSWDLGFRTDFMFGTDSIFTQAYGNPAFDVTPHHFITGIITERGIFRAPYTESLARAFSDRALAAPH